MAVLSFLSAEAAAHGLAVRDVIEYRGRGPIGNDHVTAGLGANVRGLELGGHAAGAQGGPRPAGQFPDLPGERGDFRDEGGLWMGMGVGGVKPVNIGQQDQQVCLHAHGHHGGQGVVVPDPHFLGGHRVVFVDDGQGLQVQQTAHGVVKVLKAVRVIHIGGGEQNLGHGVIVLGKGLVIGIHELTLSHGGGGLLGGGVLGPVGEGEFARPHADGPGGDQDDLMTGVFQVTEDPAQFLHPPDVQQARGVGQGGGADFHHNTFVFHGKAPLENRRRGVPAGIFWEFYRFYCTGWSGACQRRKGRK